MSSTISAEDDAPCRGGNSPAEVVAASGLPLELGNLVLGVTGKCKLWKRERTEVARELCSHFREGLETGATADSLASAFGEPERTAALITRSRKRLRPLWWRAGRQGHPARLPSGLHSLQPHSGRMAQTVRSGGSIGETVYLP